MWEFWGTYNTRTEMRFSSVSKNRSVGVAELEMLLEIREKNVSWPYLISTDIHGLDVNSDGYFPWPVGQQYNHLPCWLHDLSGECFFLLTPCQVSCSFHPHSTLFIAINAFVNNIIIFSHTFHFYMRRVFVLPGPTQGHPMQFGRCLTLKIHWLV